MAVTSEGPRCMGRRREDGVAANVRDTQLRHSCSDLAGKSPGAATEQMHSVHDCTTTQSSTSVIGVVGQLTKPLSDNLDRMDHSWKIVPSESQQIHQRATPRQCSVADTNSKQSADAQKNRMNTTGDPGTPHPSAAARAAGTLSPRSLPGLSPRARQRLSLLLVIFTAFLTQPALAKHEAKVATSECSYTLVVNEFDVSKCPVMQADGLAPDSNYRWGNHRGSASSSSSLYARSKDYGQGLGGLARDESAGDSGPGRTGGGGGGDGGGGKDVDVIKSQVRELEGRLLEEMVRSREINSTLARHSTALSAAEGQIAAYASNFTSVFRAVMFVQRQLNRQRKINKSLNKKLSNVLLDVVEVNNVLTRVPTSPQDGTVTTTKNFDVQSVGKTRACPGVTDKSTMYRDCAAVFEGGHKQSGVYYIKPGAAACPVPVWCDMDTPPGGWLVFQRRQDGSVSFRHNWNQYRDGFGNVAGEHWLGNDNLFLLSNQDHYQLRVDLWDFTGNRVHAIYTTFRVGGERDLYQLTLTGYTGSAQDSLYRHNNMHFSTPDRDNDGRKEAHCAAEWEAGWWFNNCWFALLNGAYHNRSDVQYRGIAWNHWKREQLRKTEMKMRPVGKLDSN